MRVTHPDASSYGQLFSKQDEVFRLQKPTFVSSEPTSDIAAVQADAIALTPLNFNLSVNDTSVIKAILNN